MKRYFITFAALWAAACADPAPPAGMDGRPLDRGSADRGPAEATSTPPRRLVVVTLNTHSFQEGTTSLHKLQLLGQGLAALKADLVGLNEVMSGTFWSYHYKGQKYDGTAIIKKALEGASGIPWYAHSVGFANWSSGELMSNVVLSRTPISQRASRALSTTDFWPAPGQQRNAVYARTQIPGWGAVNLVATHTWGWDSSDTLKQIAQVKGLLASKIQGGELLNLVLGDLNVPPDSAGHKAWLNAAPVKLVDSYAEANPQGGGDPTTIKGTHRIDYILCDRRSLAFTSKLVFDGKDQPVVSDHKGVVTTFVLSR